MTHARQPMTPQLSPSEPETEETATPSGPGRPGHVADAVPTPTEAAGTEPAATRLPVEGRGGCTCWSAAPTSCCR